ncbi:MAG: Gx transporter family protein [Ruminococcaceae bacterium]|nr:Gx transporter family protein [Oscillospiraceae bacterium]
MKTLSSDKKVRLIAECAVFVGCAMMLSFVEAIIPIAVMPIPGFKIGLANIAITAAAYRLSIKSAAAVSFCRIILTFFLFGNPTSLLFSLFGASLSLVSLQITKKHFFASRFSFIGISVICALSHNVGQLTAALVLIGKASLGYALPLVIASMIYGTLSGIILNILPEKIYINNKRTEGAI